MDAQMEGRAGGSVSGWVGGQISGGCRRVDTKEKKQNDAQMHECMAESDSCMHGWVCAYIQLSMWVNGYVGSLCMTQFSVNR